MKIFLLVLIVVNSLTAQHIVDLSPKLTKIERGMIINGNDYSANDQVIINTSSINFVKPAYITFYNVLVNVDSSVKGTGKFKLEGTSRIYIRSNKNNVKKSELISKKPFGQEFLLDECTLFEESPLGTKYTIWHTNGKEYLKGEVGDGKLIKRMYYNVKLGKRFLDKQFFTD